MTLCVKDFIPNEIIVGLFILTLSLNVIGNVYIILSVISSKYMKSVTTIFMVSKSVSDLMTGCFMSMFTMLQTLNPNRAKGSTCEPPVFVELTCVSASIFSFLAVGFDRYIAVVHPHFRYITPNKAFIFVAAIWIMSGIYCLRLIVQFKKTSETTPCKMFFDEKEGGVLFRTIDFGFLFIMPLTVMGFMYQSIGRFLWKRESVTPVVLRKRKVVKFLVASLLLFGLSWGPFYCLDMNRKVLKREHEKSYVILRFIFVVMAICNCLATPAVYVLFFPTIRTRTRTAVTEALHLKHKGPENLDYPNQEYKDLDYPNQEYNTLKGRLVARSPVLMKQRNFPVFPIRSEAKITDSILSKVVPLPSDTSSRIRNSIDKMGRVYPYTSEGVSRQTESPPFTA